MMKSKYKVLIIVCWILLILCCIAKLFGANWFIAHTNNTSFIDACNYIQSSFWFYILTPLFNIFTTSIYLMDVLKQKRPALRWLTILVCYAILKTIFNKYDIVFFILDIALIMFIVPFIINHKYWLRIIIGIILNVLFQLVSMWLKLGNYSMFDENLVVGYILSIDYIIMLFLYLFYSLMLDAKKGVE